MSDLISLNLSGAQPQPTNNESKEIEITSPTQGSSHLKLTLSQKHLASLKSPGMSPYDGPFGAGAFLQTRDSELRTRSASVSGSPFSPRATLMAAQKDASELLMVLKAGELTFHTVDLQKLEGLDAVQKGAMLAKLYNAVDGSSGQRKFYQAIIHLTEEFSQEPEWKVVFIALARKYKEIQTDAKHESSYEAALADYNKYKAAAEEKVD